MTKLRTFHSCVQFFVTKFCFLMQSKPWSNLLNARNYKCTSGVNDIAHA